MPAPGVSPSSSKIGAGFEHRHWHREHGEAPSPLGAAVPVHNQAVICGGCIPCFLTPLVPFFLSSGYLAACALSHTGRVSLLTRGKAREAAVCGVRCGQEPRLSAPAPWTAGKNAGFWHRVYFSASLSLSLSFCFEKWMPKLT